jgi:N-alpha-acetyltransferase 15/16, NatA auxiliary subunit
VKPYLLSALTKGIPSLFVDIKALYHDPQKRQVIEDMVEGLRESLASGHPTPSSPPNTDEPPTTYLWTLYFLAQHHSFLSRPARALSLLDLALQHTPTLPELHTCKARLLKHGGDLYGAARFLESARLLDGQDRFLNTKCAKYRLRAGLIDEASEIFGLFTKVSPLGKLARHQLSDQFHP